MEKEAPDWFLKYKEDMRQARERIARMSPEERAALQRAADNLGRKMQSGFDPTFKNVTPPPKTATKWNHLTASVPKAKHG